MQILTTQKLLTGTLTLIQHVNLTSPNLNALNPSRHYLSPSSLSGQTRIRSAFSGIFQLPSSHQKFKSMDDMRSLFSAWLEPVSFYSSSFHIVSSVSFLHKQERETVK
ncbi:hypothetical protein NC651_021774 [Populus alba x Populus x berolinensis]|nr:hypothetical protein NC651_021774 [Populus alba x Populus x berolinensis]